MLTLDVEAVAGGTHERYVVCFADDLPAAITRRDALLFDLAIMVRLVDGATENVVRDACPAANEVVQR